MDTLSDVLGIPIDLGRFVNIDDQGVRTLTSKHWPEYFALILVKDPPFTEEQHGALEDALNFVVNVLTWVAKYYNQCQWYCHLTPSVLFSIFILVESLYEALRLLSGQNTTISNGYMTSSPGRFFEQRMRDNGWCMASVQGVMHGNASVAYFASLLPSFNPQLHPSCTEEKCYQTKAEVGDFTTQHIDAYCQGVEDCCNVAAQDSNLIAILDSGSFPAIKLQDSGGKIAVETIDARDREYIAISHVVSGLSTSRIAAMVH